MENEVSGQNKKIDQGQAEVIARLFNVTMNSALLYSSTHPTTLKNVVSLYAGIKTVLSQVETISLIANRNELFIEEWSVSETINPRRLIQQFARIGIVSITFIRGLRSEHVEILINMVGDIHNQVSVNAIEHELQNQKVEFIKVNYVRYGKIISGQTDDSINSVNIQKLTTQSDGWGRPESVLSVSQSTHSLSEKRQAFSDAITSAVIEKESSEGAFKIIESLKGEMHSAQPLTLTSLLDTLHEIKSSLAEAVEAQKITGKVIAAAEPVSSRLNELTCETILKLVKEEYNCGAVSINRLAQIIRRMLPDLKELRLILPKLKALFLSEGMPLTDYLSLVRMLDIEIDSEAIADSLSSAAEKIGVTVSEIIGAIKNEPDDAARLILLASEIRQGSKNDELQLSKFLTEYIENVSTAMALQSDGIVGTQGGKTLRKILSQIESQIINKMNECGVKTNVLQSVKRDLSKNFESVFDSATMDWLIPLCTGNKDKNPAELALKISDFIDHQSQLPRIQDALYSSLLSKGYNPESIKKIFSRLTNEEQPIKHKLTLPSSALTINNMLFLLNREINQHKRYGTPFSTMIFTVEKIIFDNKLRNAILDEKKLLIPQLFEIVKQHLREIDLLGTTGIPEVYSLFSIMTMTNYDGALIVKQRVTKSLEKKRFELNGVCVGIDVAISITDLQKKNAKDFRSYLNMARLNHQASCNAISS